ncbi:MAG: sugar nucleotide-binding protein [Solirubrobacterales bacterium]|nr:sugar nucleotide-binding protein [Solirubrobacterales bacterium]
MRKLLVTGAAGFLGAELAVLAARSGWEVVGTVLSRPAPESIRALPLDVRDAGAVLELIGVERPDVVVHTAYRQHGDEARDVNVHGAALVATAARDAGARLVHLSSDAIFRGDLGRPLREDDPADPVTPYGATKAEAETAVRTAHPGALLARTSLLYGGPGHAPSNHEELAMAAARGEREVTFFTNEVRSPVQVGDLAAALLELAPSDVAGALHLGGADALDRLAFAQLIARSRGLDPGVLRGGDSGPGRPGDCALDSARAAALLHKPLRGALGVLRG